MADVIAVLVDILAMAQLRRQNVLLDIMQQEAQVAVQSVVLEHIIHPLVQVVALLVLQDIVALEAVILPNVQQELILQAVVQVVVIVYRQIALVVIAQLVLAQVAILAILLMLQMFAK